MRQHAEELIGQLEKQLLVFKALHSILEEEARVLTAADFQRLDEVLQEEAMAVSQGLELERPIQSALNALSEAAGCGPRVEWQVLSSKIALETRNRLALLRQSLRETRDQIEKAREKAAILIENGLQFSSAVLEALCPPQTYDPAAKPAPSPVRTVLSVEC
jgi:hypothetical protein